MRPVLAIGIGLAVLAVSSCENCSCSSNTSVDVLISEAGGTVAVGLDEAVGVLVPGSGRSLAPSDPGLVTVYPVLHQPDGASLDVVSALVENRGKGVRYGGAVRLTASTGWFTAGARPSRSGPTQLRATTK